MRQRRKREREGEKERNDKEKNRIGNIYWVHWELTFLSILYALFCLTLKTTLGLDIIVRELRLKNAKKCVQVEHLIDEKVEIQTQFCTTRAQNFPNILSQKTPPRTDAYSNKRHLTL